MLLVTVVVLPYFREDEAVLRETLENRSSPAEKHMRVVLATEARNGPHSHDKSRVSHVTYSRQFTQHPLGLPTALEEIRCGTSPAVCSRLSAMLAHPGLLSLFVPSLSKFCVKPKTVPRLPVRRHGDVRAGEPHGPALRISTSLLFAHHVAYPGMSLLCMQRSSLSPHCLRRNVLNSFRSDFFSL